MIFAIECSPMHRVYISLAIVVLAVGGYIYFTNHKEAQDSSRVIPDSFENTGTETPPILPPQTPKTMNATFETNKGNIEIELLANDVPNTVANFVKLAESGFYNGTRYQAYRLRKGGVRCGRRACYRELSHGRS